MSDFFGITIDPASVAPKITVRAMAERSGDDTGQMAELEATDNG